MTNDPIIKIEQLEKSFGDLHVLKGIDLEVNRGEVVCIIGASGSGKSTLLRCINLLEEADSGHIWFDGQDLMDLKVNLNALRQKIGMVFQGFNLFNNKAVLDNCTLAPMDVKHIPKTQAEATAIKHLTTVGLADFIHADSRRLSGGQKQRVAIARALCMEPELWWRTSRSRRWMSRFRRRSSTCFAICSVSTAFHSSSSRMTLRWWNSSATASAYCTTANLSRSRPCARFTTIRSTPTPRRCSRPCRFLTRASNETAYCRTSRPGSFR